MAAYELIVKPSIEKDLRSLPKLMLKRLLERMDQLKDAPFACRGRSKGRSSVGLQHRYSPEEHRRGSGPVRTTPVRRPLGRTDQGMKLAKPDELPSFAAYARRWENRRRSPR